MAKAVLIEYMIKTRQRRVMVPFPYYKSVIVVVTVVEKIYNYSKSLV